MANARASVTRFDRDVVVIGGGPAGLYAARALAARGVSVEVLEEHLRVGDPVHCTGIVGAEVLSLPAVPQDAVLAAPSDARFHTPGGRRLAYAAPAGVVRVIDRGAFDRGLARAAQAAGATVTTGARVAHLSVGREGVRVAGIGPAGPFARAARAAVLACGASYRFQRGLDWGAPGLFLTSAQVEMDAAAATSLDIFLRPDLGPTGFAWLVPITRDGRPRAKVGVMAPGRAGRALDRLVADLAAAGRVTGPRGPVRLRMLPLAPLSRTHGDRVLAVGDAAGLAKPTTGGGIYYSLLSAEWAAEALAAALAKGDLSAAALAPYERAWKAHLGAEVRVGVWFRRLAAHLEPEDFDTLVDLAERTGVLGVVRATARFNWHRRMILETLRHPAVLGLFARRLFAGRPAARLLEVRSVLAHGPSQPQPEACARP